MFRKSVEKIQFSLKSEKNIGYLTWRPIYIFFIISRSFHLRMRNVSDKIVEKIKTHILYSVTFFRMSCFLYEIVWKNIVEAGRPQMTMWCMRITCWTPKATNTHTQVVLYLLFFHSNNGCTNAPQCYVIRTLPVLLLVCFLPCLAAQAVCFTYPISDAMSQRYLRL
jgi:hypothetical protein